MSATIIDFAAHRALRTAREARAREDAFDEEIVRRLRALLAGQPIPDNPYAPDAFADDVNEDAADRRPFAPGPAA